jgi:hypothetical protein
MGMFDTIIIDLKKLPATAEEIELMERDFQTKDLNCRLDIYEIKDDQLIMVKHMDEELIENRECHKKINFDGGLNFYSMDSEDNWYEFNAIFKKGKLQKINRVSAIEIEEQNDHIKKDVLKLQEPISNKKIDALVNEFRKALRQKKIKDGMKISKS